MSVPATVEVASRTDASRTVALSSGGRFQVKGAAPRTMISVPVAVGAETRGKIGVTTDGYYRSFALPFAATDHTHPVKWTDQAARFRHMGYRLV